LVTWRIGDVVIWEIDLPGKRTNSPTHQFTNSPNSIVLTVQRTGQPRVVITGIGVVSPFGVGRERFWNHISAGCSATRAITDFDASEFGCRVAAPVPSVTIDDVPAIEGDDIWDEQYRADPKRYSRAALVGVIAAREAWIDAGLRIAEPQAGVIVGSGGGGIDVGERQYNDFFVERGRKVTPYAIPVSIVGMVSSEISISLRLRGISHVLSCGCTSSTDAISYAASLIRAGDADVLLSGGTDACVTPGMIFGFSRMKVVSMAYNDRPSAASRPFDRGRDGFVLGEGAGMLILEELEFARARGASIYAELVGYGMSADAYHITAPHPEGAGITKVMFNALEDANISASEIDYVNTHGTSTPLGDIGEIRAIQKVFGDHAYKMNISSTKSMTGHLLGAAGAIESIACLLAINQSIVPPTINHFNDDPDLDPRLNLTFLKAQKREVNVALSNTFGFGGHNFSIIFKKA
jgi:3-oxoacyl-[acyl-carrier-protein] synthase II